VLDAIRHEKFDLVLMDLNYARDTTSGKEGLDLIERIHALDHDLPIVVMTAWATVDLAVESMRLGVRDFVQKPWENSGLLRKLKAQIDYGRLVRNQEAAAQSRERQMKLELDEAREIQRGLMPRRMPHSGPLGRRVRPRVVRVAALDAVRPLGQRHRHAPGVALGTGHATGEGTDILVAILDVAGSRYGDVVKGNAVANTLRLGKGNDQGVGRAGDDMLLGGPGNDDLDGGGGMNTNDGGDGNDHCLNPDPVSGALHCESP